MSSSGFFLDVRSLQAHVPAPTYARGLDIYRSQQVLDYTLQPASSSEWHIEGEVQGSERAPYETSVLLEIGGAGRVTLFHGDCSCPVGSNCKHAVALALKAAYKAGGAQAPAPPAPPQQSADQARQQVGQWLGLFDVVEPAIPASPAATADRFVYLLAERKQRSANSPTLTLAWGYSRPLKRGGWTRVKQPHPYAYYAPRHGAANGSPDDQECVRLITALEQTAYHHGCGIVQGQAGVLALQLAARTGRLFAADADGEIAGAPLQWGPPRPIRWEWQEIVRPAATEPLWALRPLLDGSGQSAVRLFTSQPPFYLDAAAGLCGLAEAPGIDSRHLPLLLGAPPIPQSAFEQQQAALLERLAGLPLPPTVTPPEVLQGVTPAWHLHIEPVPPQDAPRLGPLRATLRFDYAGLRGYWPHFEARVLAEHAGHRVLLHRQLAAEMDARQALQRLGLVDDGLGAHHLPPGVATAIPAWLDWAANDFAPLREAGFTLDLDARLQGFIQQADTLELRLAASGGDAELAMQDAPQDEAHAPSPWFDLSLGIEIDGVRQNVLPWLPELLAQLRPTADGADLPAWIWRRRNDGGYVRLPSAPLRPWLQALLELVGERGARDFEGEVLRLSRLEALRAGASLGEGAQWSGAAQLRELLRQLGGHSRLPETVPPAGLRAELRPYQRHGLDWLQFLRTHGLAGILADDMGLGKTLQTLAHILAEKEAGRLDRPCLVVAPVSLLGNWQREAARFAPELRTLVWHGHGRHDAAERIAQNDLVIVPYSLLQRDRERWQTQPWHLVVLDEAQNIKNASTHAAQVAGALDARHRLCLSGTPLENHLGELWSLFHFLMPGFLGSQARFKELFRTPIEKHGDSEQMDQLRRRVTPFMLRRTKSIVAAELPEKVDSTTLVALAGAQADLYETIRLATEKAVRQALADKGLAKSQIQILDALLKLRQVCCDPRLLPASSATRKVRQSAKLDLLMEMLPEMLAEGRRVLLFSQFTSMLALIEAELKTRGMAWTKLTGQTQQRERVIARFTQGEVPLFLISLKAGGTGLNLPQADTVIHYDPWWNPAVEDQATGRAHRIGQRNRVFVYRLVAEGTIEERILALQARKAALAESLYRGAAARREPLFTESDVADLLRPLGA
ncbi:DEAD/DEAH box helicase [Ramlibacter sp. H39-3-26]|uniref:DEAD/DEAH box helicase n=1 Tax=Curvibacter soli TaxID=3031331 RepID=UPI0023DB1423|nr:DEAD/DEAH box helicase [Ramlibacter sp. H39-3-26]MDF1485851.1 DEAD/DEAH box helicase [Ramlibacter sp. H39-3-26]